MASTGLRYERLESGRIWRRYEVSTGETVEIWAPRHFYDDMRDGAVYGDSLVVATPWIKIDTNTGASVALATSTDAINGAVNLICASDNYAMSSIIDWGDRLMIPITTAAHTAAVPEGCGTQIEFRAKLTTASAVGIQTVMGVAGAHNDTLTSIAGGAWFTTNGSLVLKCGSIPIDATAAQDNITSPVTTGNTLVTATWYIFRIDMSNPADVKFYVDGVRVCSSTTFSIVGTTTGAASSAMQPYFRVDKAAAGTTACTMCVDYVRMWGNRYGETS